MPAPGEARAAATEVAATAMSEQPSVIAQETCLRLDPELATYLGQFIIEHASTLGDLMVVGAQAAAAPCPHVDTLLRGLAETLSLVTDLTCSNPGRQLVEAWTQAGAEPADMPTCWHLAQEAVLTELRVQTGPGLAEQAEGLLSALRAEVSVHLVRAALSEAAVARGERSAVLDLLAEAVVVIDATLGSLVEANPAAVALTGYTSAELASLSVFDLYPAPEGSTRHEFFTRLREAGTLRLPAQPYVRKDGSVVTLDLRASFVPSDGRETVVAVLTPHDERADDDDVAQRRVDERLAEELVLLRGIRRRDQALLDALPTRLLVLDERLQIVYANPAYYRKRGKTARELLGRPLQEVFPETLLQYARLEEAVRTTLRTGQSARWSGFRTATADHPERVLNIRMDRLDGPTGYQLLISLDDVTEQHRQVYQLSMLNQIATAMQGIVELPRLLHAILTAVTAGPAAGLGFNRAILMLQHVEDATLNGVMGVGPDSPEDAGRIWSQMSAQQHDLRELTAAYDEWVAGGEGRLRGLVEQLHISLHDENDVCVQAMRLRQAIHVPNAASDPRVSPQLRELLGVNEFVAAPLLVPDEALGVVLADNRFSRQSIWPADVRLLTNFANQAALAIEAAHNYMEVEDRAEELARAYKAGEEMRDELVRSQQLAALGHVSAMVAHEIRTPLTAIGGFARTIANSPDNPERVRRSAEVIVDSADQLEALLRDVLEFTKPGLPQLAAHDLNQLVGEVAELYGPEASFSQIQLATALEPDLPLVQVDAYQVKQALGNLLKNAFQAVGPGGQVALNTAREARWVTVTVADNGGGIASDRVDRLFDPTYTTKPGGTGFGLAVTKRIVDDHHGELRVRSEAGTGASFTLAFPAPAPAPADDPEGAPPSS